MNLQELKDETRHRPWTLPKTKWRYYQEWNNSVFLHWKVDYEILKQFVPIELEIDRFEGTPWVSLVAFTMENIRPRYLPSFPPISNFDEINIRTYVKANGKTGVYFLSIEGGKKLSCRIAKRISALPYRFSKMKRTKDKYESRNAIYKDRFEIDFKIGDKIEVKSKLDEWLTERYALFQDVGNRINEFEIHHLEWEIHKLEVNQLITKYDRFKNLLIGEPHLKHYSKGVQVLAWDKIK